MRLSKGGILTLVTIFLFVGGNAFWFIRKRNEIKDKYEIGTNVRIKGFKDCDCIINRYTNYHKIEIICYTHAGITSQIVSEDIIEPCKIDEGY